MTNIAIVFPGQGSQANLMGTSFKENSCYQDIQKIAYQLNPELEAIINSEDDSRINQTEYSQLAICTNQLGIWNIIKNQYIPTDYAVAGFSLGEYTAFSLAGELSYETALNIVNKRAVQMAKLNGVGTMKAIIGLNYNELENLLEDLNMKYNTNITIANYNMEKQIVVAGSRNDFELIDEELTMTARKVVELKVSGAFHTDIFSNVAKEFTSEITEDLPINLNGRFYSNISADIETSIDSEYLIEHMVTGVNWYNQVNKMLDDGIDTFIEIGEKSVLIPMIKKINRKVKTIHINCEESIKNLEDLWTSK